MKPLYLLLLLSAFSYYCNGQSKIIKPKGWHEEDNIRCGLQDKAGNMWFGTGGEGVYLYDGKSFTNFTTKDGLSGNVVVALLEDKAGNIWLGTDSGVCRYDGKIFTTIPIVITNAGSFYAYGTSYYNPSAKNAVLCMLLDKSGKFWFGTTEGVYCYNGKTFSRFLDNDGIINKDSLHLKRVDCIIEDKKGDMWFCSGVLAFEGICHYERSTKKLTNYKPEGEGWIRCVLEDKAGNLWFGTRHQGLWKYDGHTYTNFSAKVGLGKSIYSVTSIIEDKRGNLWFGVESAVSGVWHYDNRTFTTFTTKDGLVNNSVWSITEDRKGNVWVGSRNNGLSRYDGKTFTAFTE